VADPKNLTVLSANKKYDLQLIKIYVAGLAVK